MCTTTKLNTVYIQCTSMMFLDFNRLTSPAENCIGLPQSEVDVLLEHVSSESLGYALKILPHAVLSRIYLRNFIIEYNIAYERY